MQEPLADASFRAVIEEYETRAAREEALWETLSAEEIGRRRDEMLLPVGRAAGLLLNLLVQEGGAKRILEVGSFLWLFHPLAGRCGARRRGSRHYA